MRPRLEMEARTKYDKDINPDWRAFVFQAIEGAEEVERALGMARARNATALYLWTNVALPLNTLNETNFKHSVNMELLRYQQKIVLARRRGWEGGSGSSGDLRRWNFSSAFLYCLTVITTIVNTMHTAFSGRSCQEMLGSINDSSSSNIEFMIRQMSSTGTTAAVLASFMTPRNSAANMSTERGPAAAGY
ncbi:hypothetical protein EVAR_93248_1 [Eumeta japonica]|uniref:Uncharacterized protein n=1 Tax=Eumeta variegata TaxID=151549 RepID=A0A4C1TXU9_EUMVA|nr:hypothetical protein EVAR_93248_1 [Eumeta japonica]